MIYAFERSVGVDALGRSAGVEEQATVANNVADAIMATIESSVFNGGLFNVNKIQFSVSAGNPVG
jgi:hypothetical protein